ncbi:MAG: PQQ-binding-like beta-propeller repeat protein [Phycisphaerales bacterium]|nr:MAG: PQQ-binding-like beta-propeller repeat protein [Phycisphaerales bacterium]
MTGTTSDTRRSRVRQWLLILAVLSIGTRTPAADWPHWRGAEQQGTSPEKGLPSSWSQGGENLLWHAPVGCRSTPLVLNDRVYVISRVGEDENQQERVVALDLDTGRIVWERRFNAFLTDVVYHRLGWANLAADPATGNIYAHGVQGLMFCFDKDGKILWQRSLTEEFGRISGYGGRTYSPIIEGDQVIISSLTSGWGAQARGAHRFFGMDKRTGKVLWTNAAGETPLDTGYSVPVTTTLDGARIMFTGLADGSIAALRPYTGETVWRVPLSGRGMMSSVVYDDERVYATHGAANLDTNVMGRLVCLDARTGRELWRVDGLTGQYTTPALHDGLLFVADNAANLHAVDAKSGEVLWTFNYGNEAKGSPVYADGKIYVGDVPGGWRILEVSRAGCKLLNAQEFVEASGAPDEVYATAAVAHGRVILSTLNETFCISTKPRTYRSAATRAVFGPAAPLTPGRIVRLQVEPAEVVVAPGQRVQFTAKGFDEGGIPTGAVDASYSLAGLDGTIDANGTFSAGGARVQAGQIKATAGTLNATARVRVVPPLPYREDFENLELGQAPPGWITSPVKSQVAEYEGHKVLRKLAERPAPPFARLRCYIMPPIPTGYTVRSDVLGVPKRNRFLPDMGLINSRYLLILTGTSERHRLLRLVSWSPVPRIIREIPYPWEGDKWYATKLSVDVQDGRGLVRAKVWPRDEPEPDDWTLTMEDPCPNPAGSPGLYAYSVAITSKTKGTEVLFDNVAITPNGN